MKWKTNCVYINYALKYNWLPFNASICDYDYRLCLFQY